MIVNGNAFQNIRICSINKIRKKRKAIQDDEKFAGTLVMFQIRKASFLNLCTALIKPISTIFKSTILILTIISFRNL